MLEFQVFQVFGIIYLVIGLGMIINTRTYRKMILNFSENTSITYLSGAVSIFVGYLLLTFFNSSSWNLTLILTIVGWIAMVKGSLILMFPKLMSKFVKIIKERLIFSLGVVAVALGLIFLYIGYMA